MKLPSLHKGYWIYQSPRILTILAYLRFKGIEPEKASEIVKMHTNYVKKLAASEEKWWIVKKLEQLGYERKRPWAKDVGVLVQSKYLDYYLEKLGIQGRRLEILADTILRLLSILKARNEIDGVAYLPPMLTLPEKIVLLDCISNSEAFDLKTSLDIVIESWLKTANPLDLLEGELNEKRKQYRFRYTYLITLCLIAGDRSRPRPTSLGLLVRLGINYGKNPLQIYVRALLDYGKIEAMMLLDTLSLNITVKKMLEEYLKLVSDIVLRYTNETITCDQLMTTLGKYITRLPLDVQGYTAISVLKRVDEIMQIIET